MSVSSMDGVVELAEQVSSALRWFALFFMAFSAIYLIGHIVIVYDAAILASVLPRFILTLSILLAGLLIIEGVALEIGEAKSIHCGRCLASLLIIGFAAHKLYAYHLTDHAMSNLDGVLLGLG